MEATISLFSMFALFIVSAIAAIIGGQRPDRWNITGVLIMLVGVAVIAFGPRASQ